MKARNITTTRGLDNWLLDPATNNGEILARREDARDIGRELKSKTQKAAMRRLIRQFDRALVLRAELARTAS